MEYQPEEARSFLAAVWSHRRLVALLLMAGALLGGMASYLRPREYAASAKLFLAVDQPFQPLQQAGSSTDPARFVANQAELMTSTPVLAAAARSLNGGTRVEQLQQGVTAVPSATSDALTITATAYSAVTAARWANAVSTAYQALVVRTVQATARSAAAASSPGAAGQILSQARLYDSGVAVAETALPSAATTSSRATLLVLGAVLGLLLGIGIALWRDGRAPRRTPGGRPAGALNTLRLGETLVLSTSPSDPIASGLAVSAEATAAYRSLAVALDYTFRRTGGGVVLVTGARRGTGTTHTALNLAVASSVEGRRTLLVDANEANPDLTRRAELQPERGLLHLADRTVALHDVMTVWSPTTGVNVALIPMYDYGIGGIQAAERARHVFDRLQDEKALVIIDGPPLNSPEGLALAGRVSGILLVTPEEVADTDVADLSAVLTVVDTPLVGVVITHPRGRRFRARTPLRAAGTTPPASFQTLK